jgi:hypothetical protein
VDGGDGGEKGGNSPARFLTPRRSSGGDSRQQRSDEAVMAMATEVRRRRWRCGLGFAKQEAVAAGCAQPRAQGGNFIARPRDLGVWAWGSARQGRPYRAVAGLGLEPESGSRWKTRPTGGARLSAREKGEKRRGAGWLGPGDEVSKLGQCCRSKPTGEQRQATRGAGRLPGLLLGPGPSVNGPKSGTRPGIWVARRAT